MKNKRLLQSFSFIDDKYVKEAEPKMTNSSVSPFKAFARVACFVLVIALGLYLFIPFSTKGPDLTAYSGSEYFPIIEKISAYSYRPSPYKNNFQHLAAEFVDFFFTFGKMGGAAPDASAPDNANGSNGKYEEFTDNQVNGVIEADLQKTTDKYIFRLGTTVLSVYSIDGDNTAKVSEFEIPGFNDEKSDRYYERVMYLSEDASTITVISPYYDNELKSRVRIISIDVSDIQNISIKKTVSIDGNYITSRMVDGKLIFVSQYYAKREDIDYAKPETYIPSITDGEVTSCIRFEDIIHPQKIGSTRYSVVALIDEDTLDLVKANALLDFYSDIYVSENNVFITREYNEKKEIDNYGSTESANMSDIAVLEYSGDTLKKRGILTVNGWVNDQYSMDEYEGHFRVVTSTNETTQLLDSNDSSKISRKRVQSANLYAFNLESFKKVAEVIAFAPENESVASVRFDGDSAYVCTAIVQTFQDPVFFFDLSDYSDVTYTDTGVIEGFSTSLIQLGDGFLLGIGRDDSFSGKVEIYEEMNGKVVSVDKYQFRGNYSGDYKGYYVNREENLFGFAIGNYYDPQSGRSYEDMYILLHFNGYELVEVAKLKFECNNWTERVRAFTKDGYLYITNDKEILAVNIGQ